MIALPLLTALVAGFVHALEADHMAAVTTFVSRRPKPIAALRFGLRWGLGHSAAVVAIGGVLIALDLRLSEGVARGLEFGVGAMLVGLGVWLLWSFLHGRAHRFTEADSHGHGDGHVHGEHGGAATWVGVAHGLAGTAPLIAVLPVAFIASTPLAISYLLLFGLGTVAAMAIYALVAGVLFVKAGDRYPALGSGLRVVTALASAAIGGTWMYAALAA
jgi:nickel/cobalt transporter (NicO) family protein